MLEDFAVIGGLWAALYHPWVFVALLAVFILLLIWLLPKLWRGVRTIFRAIGRLFSTAKAGTTSLDNGSRKL